LTLPASPADPAVLTALRAMVDDALQASPGRLVVIGICGAQGSGKSTISDALASALREDGIATAVLSIDDIYLTHSERKSLAQTVHPLLATRGVPGTHDVALGLATIAALERGEATALPRFDKATDDRLCRDAWPLASSACRVLIFEGWCVGASAEPIAALPAPMNALEAEEDPASQWRQYANGALAGPYRGLFAPIDRLALLAAPGFEVVFDWRMQQERELARSAGPDASAVMDEAQVARFIQHYERITRHILREMPGRADCVVQLDQNRRLIAITSRHAG
jgi:D-glycerate 3-kinase